jgi:hypothetical protein
MTRESVFRIVFSAVLFAANAAQAAFITWNLEDVQFSEGTKLTGSFEYQRDPMNPLNDQVGDFDLKAEASVTDPALTAFEWTPQNSHSVVGGTLQFVADLGAFTDRRLGFSFPTLPVSPMPGEHVQLLIASDTLSGPSGTSERFTVAFNSGSLVAVPEPSILSFLTASLMLLIGMVGVRAVPRNINE